MSNTPVNHSITPGGVGLSCRVTGTLRRVLFGFCGIWILVALVSCTQTQEKPVSADAASPDPDAIRLTDAERRLYQDGIKALKNQDYSAARRLFTEFANERPELAGAHTNLALISLIEEDVDQSLTYVNKALEVNPNQAQAYQLRGQILVQQGNIHDARKDYVRATELDPGYINAQYNLALLYDIYLQDLESAIEHYENYLSLLDEPDTKTQEWVDHLERALSNE
jgi:tetratricopeptide (TPR) repeat protein